MIQSIYIYGILLCFMIECSIISYKRSIQKPHTHTEMWHWDLIFPIIVFSIIMGMRYDVGIDYLSYREEYKDFLLFGYPNDRMEYGFLILEKILVFFRAHYFFFFFIFAFIQIYFTYLVFVKNKELYLLPFVAFSLICTVEFLSWSNTIRQAISCCIFVYSIRYTVNKNFLWYIFFITIAVMFHNSAIILYPLYFVFIYDIFYLKSITLQLSILFIAVYLSSSNILSTVVIQLDYFMKLVGYGDRFDFNTLSNISNNYEYRTFGIRSILNLLISIVLIIYNKKIKSFFCSKYLERYYSMFYIGIIGAIITRQSHILQRPFMYFTTFYFIISAYLLFYLWYIRNKSQLNYLIFLLIIGLYIINILTYIYISAIKPEQGDIGYLFFWQEIINEKGN